MEFSDLALAKLLQTAPELGSLVLNFTEISEELESRGVQVGLFVLGTGAGPVYVPVVAKNENLFPIDSVFIESEGRFAPLTPATIKTLMNSSNLSQGRPTKIPKPVVQNPDVSQLVNPPRTGKYVYASASRLTEFLAAIPQNLKDFVFEKIAAEQSVYDSLDNMFGLRAIFEVLKAKSNANPASNVNSGASGPHLVQTGEPVSVMTSAQEIRSLMDDALASQFVENGYAIVGQPAFSRVAVAYQPYNNKGVFREINPNTDYNLDYEVVFRNGSTKRAYLPKYHKLSPGNKSTLIFFDGSYANTPALAMGQVDSHKSALEHLFEIAPPKLLRDCYRDETILLMTNDGKALGPFQVSSVVLSPMGAEVKVSGMDSGTIRTIVSSRNQTSDVSVIGDTMYVASNTITISLGENLTYELERNINVAANRQELITTQYLGAELDLRFDGVEYSASGKTIGGFPEAMKVLVERENIEPGAAHNFLKQAEETKFLKIYLSKKAADSTSAPTPAEIPQYGNNAVDPGEVAMNGSFMPMVSQAADLGDSQVTECAIISQLLQSPDLFEMINEYLPEINASVDKLGRLLFLSRVNIDQLAGPLDSDSVFALISKIKNVYRQLGDTALRLTEIANVSAGFDEAAPAKLANGV